MSAEPDTGFVIRDRRGGRPEGAEASRDMPASAPIESAPLHQGGAETHEGHPGMPVSFSSFVFSMGTSALMLMGERLDPAQSAVPVNLGQAKEIIDILSILETKTKGNLTGDEQSVLTEMLYALRMKFVDLSSGKSASSTR